MNKVTKFLLAVVGCEVVGILAIPFTRAAIPTWYATLEKPFFSPPNWIFGPIWTLLYFLMGISLYLIWQAKGTKITKQTALTYFGIQLFLNFLWSPLFFGLHATIFALIDILVLIYFVVRTILAFGKISKTAAGLLIPYLLWISFATLLTIAIVFLNS